jgi:hypothetical protein
MSGIPYQAAVISENPGWLLRKLGARRRDGRGIRFKWGEWTPRWGIGLTVINWEEDADWSISINPIYGKFYVKLPFLPARTPEDDNLHSWGFDWDWAERAHHIYLQWGARSRFIDMPWDWRHVRSDMLCDDGVWRKSIGSWERKEGDPVPAQETHPYRYVTRGGTVQDDIQATITVLEMEWRWRALRWLPWPRMVRRTIEVTFSQEVGEKRGSWKGGCIGCGYEMKRGETPLECLRRMLRDRRFE